MIPRSFRSLVRKVVPPTPCRAARLQSRLRCQPLEARTVPTVDLILDFDGGFTPDSPNYNNISGTTDYKPFVAFPTALNTPGDRTEQILQIVAAVRQNFADFDCRVIWDDRGVNSPFFSARDAVMMVANDFGQPPVIGLAPQDLFQQFSEAAVTFVASIAENNGTDAVTNIAETVSTITHEFGHALGQSHVVGPDSEGREIMGEASSYDGVDERFSPEPQDHLDPEAGVIYSERDRLERNIGFALAGTTIGKQEALTNQVLFFDTPTISLDGLGLGIFRGTVSYSNPTSKKTTQEALSIDFAGDRDAFRITLQGGVTYAIRQRAAQSSPIEPVFTIWDPSSKFLAASSIGTAGGAGVLTFTPSKTGTYYLIAGSSYDRTASGVVGTPTIGGYHLEITPTWFELDTVSGTVRLLGTGAGNSMSAVQTPGGLSVISGANTFVFPPTLANRVEFAGEQGSDAYRVDLTGGPVIAVVNDKTGFDRLTVVGSAGDDDFTISPGLITTAAGASVTVGGASQLDITGGSGSDLFRYTAGPIPVSLAGNEPTSAPGDRLSILTPNATNTALGDTGVVTFPTGQPVSYSGIEVVTLDGKEPPIVVPPPPPTPRGFAVANGAGTLPEVTLYAAGNTVPTYKIMAYNPSFRGGVRVATGDVDGDGTPDLITAAGFGGGPHIQVFSGKQPQLLNAAIGGFFAYDARFGGGVYVAAGDVNGDGRADVITGAGESGGPHVRVFDGATGAVLTEFFAYDPRFTGGVRVAVGDVNGDKLADVITAAGPGGGPHVRVFNIANRNAVINEFFAFDIKFNAGVFVTTSDVTGDGRDDIVTGGGDGAGPLVTIRDGLGGALLSAFNAFPPNVPGSTGGLFTSNSIWASGVRVAASDTDLDGIDELYVMPGRGRPGTLKTFLLAPFTELGTRAANDPTFLGGLYVGS